jgi:hypothetical protein
MAISRILTISINPLQTFHQSFPADIYTYKTKVKNHIDICKMATLFRFPSDFLEVSPLGQRSRHHDHSLPHLSYFFMIIDFQVQICILQFHYGNLIRYICINLYSSMEEWRLMCFYLSSLN